MVYDPDGSYRRKAQQEQEEARRREYDTQMRLKYEADKRRQEAEQERMAAFNAGLRGDIAARFRNPQAFDMGINAAMRDPYTGKPYHVDFKTDSGDSNSRDSQNTMSPESDAAILKFAMICVCIAVGVYVWDNIDSLYPQQPKHPLSTTYPTYPRNSDDENMKPKAFRFSNTYYTHYVTAPALNVRSGPGSDHPLVLAAPLPKGSCVRVTGRAVDGWRKVSLQTKDGTEVSGYVSGIHINRLGPNQRCP